MPRPVNGDPHATLLDMTNTLKEKSENSTSSLLPSPSGSSVNSNEETLKPNHQLIANTSTSASAADDCDEIKVYNEEGAAEEEQHNSDNLSEEKTELIEEKPTSHSSTLPFSVNNFLFGNTAAAANSSADSPNAAAAAAAAAAANPFFPLGYPRPFGLYPPELAHHFASWWPAAAAAGAAAFYNPVHNPFSAFSAAAAAASYHQQLSSLSRFSPSLLFPAAAAASASSSSNNNNSTNNPTKSSSSTSSVSSVASSPFSTTSSNSSSNNRANHLNNSTIPKPAAQGAQNSNFTNLKPPKMTHMPNGGVPPPAPPHITQAPKSKKPHIKKPLNAFMLFMKEQRSQVVSECTLRESAAINQILGRKWHELERSEQAKYYEMARQERLKHMQLYPGWSARDNYGLKKKRRRKREKVIGENGELPRKCRARYGLQQIHMWCKPCRRKKKCIRYSGMEDANGQNGNAGTGVNNGMIMGPNGPMYANGMFNGNPMMMESGSAGSLNGGNSEDDYEDDYDDLGDDLMHGEDDSEEETDSEDDENDHDDEKEHAALIQSSASGLYNNYSPYHHHHHPHPNKKPNLDLQHMNPIQQQQQQQQQQVDSKHNIMQQIHQMHQQMANNGNSFHHHLAAVAQQQQQQMFTAAAAAGGPLPDA